MHPVTPRELFEEDISSLVKHMFRVLLSIIIIIVIKIMIMNAIDLSQMTYGTSNR